MIERISREGDSQAVGCMTRGDFRITVGVFIPPKTAGCYPPPFLFLVNLQKTSLKNRHITLHKKSPWNATSAIKQVFREFYVYICSLYIATCHYQLLPVVVKMHPSRIRFMCVSHTHIIRGPISTEWILQSDVVRLYLSEKDSASNPSGITQVYTNQEMSIFDIKFEIISTMV